jgi:hypothetical protein
MCRDCDVSSAQVAGVPGLGRLARKVIGRFAPI